MQLVRDEEDGIALLFQVQKLLKQLLRLLRRQNGRGLVQNDDPGPAVHGF